MLHLSSVAAIGKNTPVARVITEQNKWESRKALSDYAVSKFRLSRKFGVVWQKDYRRSSSTSIILGACDWEQSSGRLFRLGL